MTRWEIFTHKGQHDQTPTVSITRRGQISLSRSAVIALGEPRAVNLLFAKRERLIGIRVATVSSAFTMQKSASGRRAVSAVSFLRHYAIDFSKTRRYRAVWDGEAEMFVVDLTAKPLKVTE